jgi:hypothetical protein
MGSVLDSILVEEMIDSPITINQTFVTDAIDISNREQECSIQTLYTNGNNVNMKILLEVSNDGVQYSTVIESEQTITDPDGSDIIDIFGTGTRYLRVKIEVISGSIDVQRILWTAKRRH